MKLIPTFGILSAISSSTFAATQLTCRSVDKENFVQDQTLSVAIDTRSLRIMSDLLQGVGGQFEKTVKSTGDLQYSVPNLTDLMDQSDVGKAFVSADFSRITFTVRFTDDDGPQSWLAAHFQYTRAN